MKKYFKFLCFLMVIFISTGCVKMDMSMSINKDKSMELSITEAVLSSLVTSDSSFISDDDLDRIKKEGFAAEEYSDGNMTGYTFKKSIKNIDDVSTTESITGNIGVGLGDDKAEDDNLFTVKKGLFKNKYTAKLKSSDTDYANNEVNSNESDSYDESDSSISLGDLNYSSLMNPDMKFRVSLPYKALSSNATAVSDDGKSLTWDFLKLNGDNISFEFELYNMTNIYIAGAVLLFLIVLIILIFINKNKGKKNAKVLDSNEEVEMLFDDKVSDMEKQADISVFDAKPMQDKNDDTLK